MTTIDQEPKIGSMMFKYAIGQVIKKYRIDRGMTQRQLAASGYFAHNYLSEVERGVKTISFDYLDNIAEALDVPVHDLVIDAGYLMAGYSKIPDTIESLFGESIPTK